MKNCDVGFQYGVKGVACEMQHFHIFQGSSETPVFPKECSLFSLEKGMLKLKQFGLSGKHFAMLVYLEQLFLNKYVFFCAVLATATALWVLSKGIKSWIK